MPWRGPEAGVPPEIAWFNDFPGLTDVNRHVPVPYHLLPDSSYKLRRIASSFVSGVRTLHMYQENEDY